MQKLITSLTVLVLFLALLSACTVSKPATGNAVSTPQPDSTEYEMIVFDSGFESWYALHSSKATERTIEYYRSMNQLYAREWNYKATSARHNRFFASTINYEPSENYPLEIERKLYSYFRYVETELRIPILRRR